jgi:hypothetical protein
MYLLKPREDPTMLLFGRERAPLPREQPMFTSYTTETYQQPKDDDLDLSPNWEVEEKVKEELDRRQRVEQKKKNVEEAMGPSNEQPQTCPHEDELTQLRQLVSQLWNKQNQMVREIHSLRTNQRRQKFKNLQAAIEKIPNKTQKEALLESYYDVEYNALYTDVGTLTVENNPLDGPTPTPSQNLRFR